MYYNGLSIDKIMHNATEITKAYWNSQNVFNKANLILDNIDSAVLSLALKKLKTSATQCIRVRRDTDNTELDIGFVGNVLDTTTLLNFCGSGNGFVSIWYDQSGLDNNALQTTASSQPQIVISGVLTNGILFDGVDDWFKLTNSVTVNVAIAPFSIFTTLKKISTSFGLISKGWDSGSLQYGVIIDSRFKVYTTGGGYTSRVSSSIIDFSEKRNLGFIWDGQNISTVISGNVDITNTYAGNLTTQSHYPVIGKMTASGGASGSSYFQGNMNSLTMYNGNFVQEVILTAEQQISL